MPYSHKHPSYNCYRSHKCRCRGCLREMRVVRERYYRRANADRMYPLPTLMARLYREVLGTRPPGH